MRRQTTLRAVVTCAMMWGPVSTMAQPVAPPGCKLQLDECGNTPVLCHIFANQATDMPDPLYLNGSASDEGPLEAKEWATRCYRLYVVKNLDNNATRAATDSLALIYSALAAATQNTIPSVFSTVFYNPDTNPHPAAVVYIGATKPLPDQIQTDDPLPSTKFVMDNSKAIFKSLEGAGLEKIVVAVPPKSFAMKVYTPRSIPNPKPGFYGAGTLSLAQQEMVFLDPKNILLLGVFRRVDPNSP